MALETWPSWASRIRCNALRSVPRARKALEDAAVKLGARVEALPWRPSSAAA
jgi:hypothetical protein